MLLRSIKNHPHALIEFQTIKAGQRNTGTPDHGFFTRHVPEGKFLVNKETVGYGNDEDCTLNVFPDENAVRLSRPVFIFRDPRATFVSWMENNLISAKKDPQLFIKAYRHVFALLMNARNVCENSSAITYESLCQDPEPHLRKLCNRWGIDFHPHMLNWKDNFIDTTPLDEEGVDEGHYRVVSEEKGIRSPKEKAVLDASLAEEIENALRPLYKEITSICLQQ